jgi:CrcB protein
VSLAALSAFVAAGGAAGALARFWVGIGAVAAFGTAWPWGTLVVNVTGSFAIGAVASAPWATEGVRAAVVTGFLGGFTTFSAFSLETVRIIETGRTAEALAYVAAHLLLCLGAAAAGALTARMIAA